MGKAPLFFFLYSHEDHSFFQLHSIHPKRDDDLDDGGSGDMILYIGLGMMAVGLVITFVGLGDKGFKTLELKLIGPSLVGCGMFFALLRILYCTMPSYGKNCCGRNEEYEKLLKNEELLAELNENKFIRNMNRNRGVNPINDDNLVVRSRVTHQQNTILECWEVGDGFRPRLKPLIQEQKISLNGGPYSRQSKEFEDNSSFSSSREPHLGGSTKDLRTSEIIMNSETLYSGNKKRYMLHNL